MEQFEVALASYLDCLPTSRVKEAMRYSLLAKGKRVRPALLFACLEGYGLSKEVGFKAAAAIEMIHTYSLIHDDLPALDDDEMRRGVKTCHKQFDEATAILAGDALLTHAFYLASNASINPIINNGIVRYISEYSGAMGMVYGQNLDLEGEDNTSLDLDDLKKIHYYKTGKLLTLPCILACLLAEQTRDLDAWIKFAQTLGLAFQVQDDILDCIASSDVLGKTTSDVRNQKTTYVSLLNIDEAQNMVDTLFDECKTILNTLNCDHQAILTLLEGIINRKK